MFFRILFLIKNRADQTVYVTNCFSKGLNSKLLKALCSNLPINEMLEETNDYNCSLLRPITDVP